MEENFQLLSSSELSNKKIKSLNDVEIRMIVRMIPRTEMMMMMMMMVFDVVKNDCPG